MQVDTLHALRVNGGVSQAALCEASSRRGHRAKNPSTDQLRHESKPGQLKGKGQSQP